MNPRQLPASAVTDALQFKVEEDTNIHLVCPWCSEALWITGAETLRDVAESAVAHDCDEGEAS